MNKFAASLGLIALGTTALHAVEATALNPMQRSKPWSVAASLRGFYDDNINLSPTKQDSFGYEIVPSVDFGLAGDQTSFNLGYELNARYFENKPAGQSDRWAFNQIFEGNLNHQFNPRLSMGITDSFVMGNEPDLHSTAPESNFQYLGSNDNIINYGGIDFNIETSDLLAFNVGYNNGYFHYDDSGGGPGNPSTAGMLNRIDNHFNIDSQWKLQPQTVGILGYMYGQTLYTGNELIGSVGSTLVSSDRNARSSTFYVGAQHSFTPTLSGLVKVGAQYYDYYNDPAGGSQWSPYVQANIKYQYQSTTVLDFGFQYNRVAADVVGAGTTSSFVKDSEVALLYGSVSHELVAHLVATGKTTVQYGTYNGGGAGFNDESYLYFQLALDLGYQFTPNFSAHAGYTFDDYNSDASGQPDYNRNRVYIGVTAGY